MLTKTRAYWGREASVDWRQELNANPHMVNSSTSKQFLFHFKTVPVPVKNSSNSTSKQFLFHFKTVPVKNSSSSTSKQFQFQLEAVAVRQTATRVSCALQYVSGTVFTGLWCFAGLDILLRTYRKTFYGRILPWVDILVSGWFLPWSREPNRGTGPHGSRQLQTVSALISSTSRANIIHIFN